VLRPGDCVIDKDQYIFAPEPELPCAHTDAAYQVVARIAKPDRCPAGTDKVIDLGRSPRPRVCTIRRAR